MKKDYFVVEDADNIFTVRLNEIDGLSFVKPRGSYNILKSRLFNITYPDYLRMVQQNYSAQLKGRKGYIVEFFMNKSDADKICKELNCRLNSVLKLREETVHENIKNLINSRPTE